MKKNLLIIGLCLVTLASCVNNQNRNSTSVDPSTNISTLPSSSTNGNSTIENEGNYINVTKTIDFFGTASGFSNAYEAHDVIIDEANYKIESSESRVDLETSKGLVRFDNASKQNSIPNYPIINAYKGNEDTKTNYVNFLSGFECDVEKIDLKLSIWNNGDLENSNVENKYIGVEYLNGESWVRLDKNIAPSELDIGSYYDELKTHSFTIEAKHIHDFRLVFEFKGLEHDVRFALFEVSVSGKKKVVEENKSLTSIQITNENNVAKVNTPYQINVIATPSNINDIEFISKNRSIARVDANGLVIPLSVGTVVIVARNGEISDSITLTVFEQGANYEKIIQEKVSFLGEVPEGFTDDFASLSFFNGSGEINFKKQNDAILTPTYSNITGSTVVVLNMRLSTSASIELSRNNEFAVQGLNSNNEVVEEVSKKGINNLTLEDVTFEFKHTDITSYRIYFKLKYQEGYATGKNYCLNSLVIYQK